MKSLFSQGENGIPSIVIITYNNICNNQVKVIINKIIPNNNLKI